MDSLFVGQIAIFPYGGDKLDVKDFAECTGAVQAISGNTALYGLIGTTYGGNGTTNFAVPDLQGRAPVSYGTLRGGGNYLIGKQDGGETVALTEDTTPMHVHRVAATTALGTTNNPKGMLLATVQGGLNPVNFGQVYNQNQPGIGTWLRPETVASAPAAGMPHNNMQPSLALHYGLLQWGIFPQFPKVSTSYEPAARPDKPAALSDTSQDIAYLGQIHIFALDFAPKGFAKCDGQLLPINQNRDLFALLGTSFGGDGINTFALPDLRGRAPIGQGQGSGLSNRTLGEKVGEESHALTPAEVGVHTHRFSAEPAATATNTNEPGTNVIIAKAQLVTESQKTPVNLNFYVENLAPTLAMHPDSIQTSAGNQPHANMMPYLTLNVCIAVEGEFPPRN